MNTRYDRQIKHWGISNQNKLSNSCVAIIGAGGIGSACAELLCRSGVGELIVFDNDLISTSNLNRQVLYKESDVGKSKVKCLKSELKKINSNVKVNIFEEKLTFKNLDKISRAQLILDCTDKIQMKLLLNKIAYKLKKKLIYASASQRDVRIYIVNPESSKPCLNCILGEKTVQKNKGILNTTAHTSACLLADTAFKILMNDDSLFEEMIIFNLKTMSFLKLKTNKKKNCAVCST
ncbi:HesA/MoeB/ThiF family protein [Candidatus Woesearchaeota archaeon]|nr:HesA/MoeB/ThiF family protein [Candidatus Woesearchaeota archaeon]